MLSEGLLLALDKLGACFAIGVQAFSVQETSRGSSPHQFGDLFGKMLQFDKAQLGRPVYAILSMAGLKNYVFHYVQVYWKVRNQVCQTTWENTTIKLQSPCIRNVNLIVRNMWKSPSCRRPGNILDCFIAKRGSGWTEAISKIGKYCQLPWITALSP